MAEIVGVVSGGAGLASLAIQLGESAQALNSFYERTKAAPALLRTLSFDIETLSLMLQEFDKYREEGSESADLLLERCIIRLESDVQNLDLFIARLRRRLERYRLGGRIWVAFEDVEIQKLLDSLERTQVSLLQAHLIYTKYVISPREAASNACVVNQRSRQRMHEQRTHEQIVLGRLDRLLDEKSSALCNICPRPSSTVATDATPICPPQNAKVSLEVTRSLKRKKMATRKSLSFILRSWLSSHVCRISMTHAGWAPTLSLHTWIHDSPSKAFNFCYDGDLLSLRRAVANREVGLRDRNRGNFTLLGVSLSARFVAYAKSSKIAALHGYPEICLFLINQCGLAADFEAINVALTVLALNPQLWSGKVGKYGDMFRLLLEKSAIDYDIDEQCLEVTAVPPWWFLCPDLETLRLTADSQVLLNSDMRLFRPDQILDFSEPPSLGSPDVLLTLFSIEWSPPGLMSLLFDVKQQLLHLAAAQLGRLAQRDEWDNSSARTPWSNVRWLNLVHDLIVAGADPMFSVGRTTALSRILKESPPRYWIYNSRVDPHPLLRCLRSWALTLQRAGIDLFEYGQYEQQTCRALRLEHVLWQTTFRRSSDTVSRRRRCVIDGLVYGTSESEWSFTIRGQRVLNIWQSCLLPGSWTDGSSIQTLDIRDEWEDTPGLGWIALRKVHLLTGPAKIQELTTRNRSELASFESTIETTQDDAGPVALTVLWRRRNHRAVKRRWSAAHASREPFLVNRQWRSKCHPWMPNCHRHSISQFENSFLINHARICSCVHNVLPEHHEYKPLWFKVFCYDDGYDESLFVPEDHEFCPDVQETRLWRRFSVIERL